MNESSHPRFVVGLILLAILCTVALGLQERSSAPLAAYSPTSPLGAVPRARAWAAHTLAPLRQALTRAAWLTPWPWIAVGLVAFSLLAWALIRVFRRMERD